MSVFFFPKNIYISGYVHIIDATKENRPLPTCSTGTPLYINLGGGRSTAGGGGGVRYRTYCVKRKIAFYIMDNTIYQFMVPSCSNCAKLNLHF